jgi:hypothetical protein
VDRRDVVHTRDDTTGSGHGQQHRDYHYGVADAAKVAFARCLFLPLRMLPRCPYRRVAGLQDESCRVL